MSELSEAINYVNYNHPLPRCVHDQALADHSGERLAPPCGCGFSYRVKELDYDARHKSKTDRACVRCQRDIKPSSPARSVHLVDRLSRQSIGRSTRKKTSGPMLLTVNLTSRELYDLTLVTEAATVWMPVVRTRARRR